MSGSGTPSAVTRVLLAAAVASVLVLPTSTAVANHYWGGTYTGTISNGGTITFTISADGSKIDSFSVADVPGEPSCTFTSASTSNIPISDHAFNRTAATGISTTGTFPSPGNGQGTVRIVNPPPFSCDSGTETWTATGPAVQPKDVNLKAKPKKVEKGEKTKLKATVSPCEGHEGDIVEFYRGDKKIAEKASNSACVAKHKVKVKKTSVFQAISPQQDADHLDAVSNKVKVKVVD